MSDDEAIEKVAEEVRLLREVVGAVVDHLAAGGYVDRQSQLFRDLRRVYRHTRDALPAIRWEGDWRYWANLACNWAFVAGANAAHVENAWAVVLDSLLEAGGRETSLARALAPVLGIELRESSDGGSTWYPIPLMRARLEEATDDELELELLRRGKQRPRARPPGLRLMLFGRVEVQHSPGLRDNLGVEFFLRRARDQGGGVIAAGTRDYQALEQFARQAEIESSMLTWIYGPGM